MITRANVVGTHKEFSLWLDVLRWLAAFAVLLSHAHHRVFVQYGDAPKAARNIAYLALTGVSSFGAPAVIIFFVLSGFLVGGTSLAKLQEKRFDLREYVVSRIVRLWIVLLPVLLITRLMLDLTSVATGDPTLPVGVTKNFDVMACNAAFLQTTVFCRQYGGNGALWSLFQEAWYYVAWPPLMLGLFAKNVSALNRVFLIIASAGLLTVLSLIQAIGPVILLYFTLWLLGIGAAVLAKPILPLKPLISAALFLVSLSIWRFAWHSNVQGDNTLREFPFDFLLAVTFLQLILSMKYSHSLIRPPFPAMHRLFASFSFSLYCLHTPLLNFLIAMVAIAVPTFAKPSLPTSAAPFILYIVLVLVCVAGAYLLYLATESRTYAARRFMLGRLRRSPVAG